MEWLDKVLDAVEKRLGKTAVKILIAIIVIIAVIASVLWVTQFAIEKTDYLSGRFDIVIIPDTINLMDAGSYLNLFLLVIIFAVVASAIIFVVLTPFLYFVRGVINTSQRGKVESLIESTKIILIETKNNISPILIDEAIKKLETIQKEKSTFRKMQKRFGGKKNGNKDKRNKV